MADEQNPNPENNPQNNTEKTPIPTVKEVDKVIEEKEDSNAGQNDRKSTFYQPPNIIVNIPEQDNSASIKANKISIASVLVNFLIFATTLLVFWQTKISVDAAVKSAKVAEQSLSATLDEYKRNRYNDSVNAIIGDKKFNLDSTSVASQIDAFKITQKEFKAENKPHIQVTDLIVTTLEAKKPIRIDYRISNFGKQPIIIDHGKTGIHYDSSRRFKNYTIGGIIDGIKNVSIQENKGISMEAHNDYIVNETLIDLIKTKEVSIFFIGEVYYTNEVTKEKGKYVFSIRIDPFPTLHFAYIVHNDIPIRKRRRRI